MGAHIIDGEFQSDKYTPKLWQASSRGRIGSAVSDIYREVRNEHDIQIAQSPNDDRKKDDDWAASLRVILTTPRFDKRRMWIKVAALAIRAVEAIDRKA